MTTDRLTDKGICHGSRFQSILVTFFLIFGRFKFSKIDMYSRKNDDFGLFFYFEAFFYHDPFIVALINHIFLKTAVS